MFSRWRPAFAPIAGALDAVRRLHSLFYSLLACLFLRAHPRSGDGLKHKTKWANLRFASVAAVAAATIVVVVVVAPLATVSTRVSARVWQRIGLRARRALALIISDVGGVRADLH